MKLHFDSVKGNLKKCNIMANIFRKSTQDNTCDKDAIRVCR